MGKREAHAQDLFGLFGGMGAAGAPEGLTDYLLSNSNLPGPRGNLELAQAFGNVVGELSAGETMAKSLWMLCAGMAEIPAAEAPANDPREFLPFCGTVGLGAIGTARAEWFEPALGALQALARDPRWRMREAVVFALQRLLAARGEEVVPVLASWVRGGHPLEMRAVAAGVAEPELLTDQMMARSALDLHREILDQVLETEQRKSEAFRTLRKGLGYTLSVVVCAAPEAGFTLLGELACMDDADMRWIVKENLKKNRLVKHYSGEVSRIQALL